MFAFTIVINYLAENDTTHVASYMKTFILQLSFGVHLVFVWNAQIPSPVSVMLEYLLRFVMYDVLDLVENIHEDASIELLFQLSDEDANDQIRNNISELGYSSVNVIVTFGTMWIVTALFFVRLAIFIVYRLCSFPCRLNGWVQPKCCKTERTTLLNEFIVIFLEGYLEFFIVIYLHFTVAEYKGKQWALIFILLYSVSAALILPILAIRVLCCKPLKQLEDEKVIEHYGPLYEDVKTESRWTVAYSIVQSVRRLAFLAIMFYIENGTI